MLLITEGTFCSPYVYLGLMETRNHNTPLTIEEIFDVVCRYSGITSDQMDGRRGVNEITQARFVYWALARKFTSVGLRKIATLTGDRDHSTVLHGIAQLDRMIFDRVTMNQNRELRDIYNQCEKHLKLYYSDVKRD